MFKNAKRCEPYKARVDEDYLIPTTLDIMKALFLMSCQISWMLNLVANLPHHGCVLQFHGNWRPSCQNCGWICLDQKQNWSFRHFEGHETSGSPPKKKTFGEVVGLLAYRAVPRDDEAEQSSIGQTQTWELEWRTSSPWMCIQELAGTSWKKNVRMVYIHTTNIQVNIHIILYMYICIYTYYSVYVYITYIYIYHHTL